MSVSLAATDMVAKSSVLPTGVAVVVPMDVAAARSVCSNATATSVSLAATDVAAARSVSLAATSVSLATCHDSDWCKALMKVQSQVTGMGQGIQLGWAVVAHRGCFIKEVYNGLSPADGGKHGGDSSGKKSSSPDRASSFG
ncbi:hypothetical protein Dimus_033747 [Dionaea muscipula]